MTDERLDQVLWDAARLEPPTPSAPRPPSGEATELDDETLRAWRDGELAPERSEAVEAALAADPQARERLADLSGIEPVSPSREGRRRALEAFRRGRSTSGSRGGWAWRAAVAAALVVVAVGLVVFLPGPRPLPDDLVYEVGASGLALERSTTGEVSGTSAAVEALPDTAVRIVARPVAGATDAVEVALYGRRADRLVRLDRDPAVTVERQRGAASFTARAADLLGEVEDGSGPSTVWVVVARPRDLPAALAVEAGSSPARLLEAEGRRRVLATEVRIVPPPAPA